MLYSIRVFYVLPIATIFTGVYIKDEITRGSNVILFPDTIGTAKIQARYKRKVFL